MSVQLQKILELIQAYLDNSYPEETDKLIQLLELLIELVRKLLARIFPITPWLN